MSRQVAAGILSLPLLAALGLLACAPARGPVVVTDGSGPPPASGGLAVHLPLYVTDGTWSAQAWPRGCYHEELALQAFGVHLVIYPIGSGIVREVVGVYVREGDDPDWRFVTASYTNCRYARFQVDRRTMTMRIMTPVSSTEWQEIKLGGGRFSSATYEREMRVGERYRTPPVRLQVVDSPANGAGE